MDHCDRGIYHVTDITAQLHHYAGVVIIDHASYFLSFVGANVDKKLLLGGELVQGTQDGGWGTPQFGVEVRVVVDVSEQGQLAAIV